MLGGRLYDPVTMNEVVTGTRVRAPYWWEGQGGAHGAGTTAAESHRGD